LPSAKTVIVVLNWNGKQDTLECLKSLQNVTGPEHEILVVDNGSEDGSEEAIRAAHPGIPVLQTGSNLGFAGGNNRGIEWALEHGADFVLLLNNDTVVAPDFLEAMVAVAREDPQVGVVGASIAYEERPDRLWAFGGGRFDIATGWVRHLQEPVEGERLLPQGNRHFYVTGCAMLLRRELLEEVGLLDTSYFHFCEDVDLCLRAEKAGYAVAVADRARILHKVSATTRVSSPLFLYYNLRSRLSLVRRHGPEGAPSARAVALLWLRLWRPALLSGMAWSGWSALRQAYRDWKEGRQGPAPAGLGSSGRKRGLLAVAVFLLLVGGWWAGGQRWRSESRNSSAGAASSPSVQDRQLRFGADARSEEEILRALWKDEEGDPPQDLAHALYAMAADSSLARRVRQRADRRSRRLTHRLLTLLDLSDRQARERIDGLYEVHDFGAQPGHRPPTWSDLRRQGVELLQAIALDPENGRDARLLREIAGDELSHTRGYARASLVAARVELWKAWWIDRGMDPRLWLDPARRPDPGPWLRALRSPPGRGGRTLLDLLEEILDHPLARRVLLDSLDRRVDEELVSECVQVAMMYQVDFSAAGFSRRHWDAQRGRMVGHNASELRDVALEMLPRVCSFLPSGATEDEVIKSIAFWWKGARFQAQYYRDPDAAPTLEPWLAGLDRPADEGGMPMPRILRQWYVADGFQGILLDQLDRVGQGLVAELIEWLGYDQEQARARGFVFAYRRMPLRPVPGDQGRMWAIPWSGVQALIREMLRRITGDAGLPEQGMEEDLRNGFWIDWWRAHAHEARWYRNGRPQPAPPRFEMERAGGD